MLQHPYHNFKDVSLVDRLLLFGRVGWGGDKMGLSQRLFMSPFLNCESAVINTMAKVASLSVTVCRIMDPGFTHGFWRQQHRPWTSMKINTDPCCRRTTDPNMVLGGSMALDITMASGGSTGHSDQ